MPGEPLPVPEVTLGGGAFRGGRTQFTGARGSTSSFALGSQVSNRVVSSSACSRILSTERGIFVTSKCLVTEDQTVVEGLENAPQASMDLLTGGNTGKMVVTI